MTLLISTVAAIISTVIWYKKSPNDDMLVHILCFLYWGASIMWFVDAVAEYMSIGAAYFMPAPIEMLNDMFLGLSVVTFGLLIWLVIVLIKDPRNVIRKKH